MENKGFTVFCGQGAKPKIKKMRKFFVFHFAFCGFFRHRMREQQIGVKKRKRGTRPLLYRVDKFIVGNTVYPWRKPLGQVKALNVHIRLQENLLHHVLAVFPAKKKLPGVAGHLCFIAFNKRTKRFNAALLYFSRNLFIGFPGHHSQIILQKTGGVYFVPSNKQRLYSYSNVLENIRIRIYITEKRKRACIVCRPLEKFLSCFRSLNIAPLISKA